MEIPGMKIIVVAPECFFGAIYSGASIKAFGYANGA
jgi:hypothetical protein